ncbi:unnamed protein product, partial [Staurois parvus]
CPSNLTERARLQERGARRSVVRCIPWTQRITDPLKGQRRWLAHVISCVQSQLIAWDMYTDLQGTEHQCVAPAVPSVSANQCQLSVPISASSMPHISAYHATYQCPSELPFSATYQCQSVPPINASQCHLSVLPFSATYQC